jgi:hypothetical protein
MTEDGLLDGNDELVFMSFDAGEAVTEDVWPEDVTSRLSPRYAITVTDPLSPAQQAWAYLYRSESLPRPSGTYITWTEALQTVQGLSYTLALETEDFVGLSELTVNGSNDILDRQKVYVNATFDPILLPPQEITLTEESVLDLVGAPPTVTLSNVGAIRAVGGNVLTGFGYAFYGSELTFSFLVDLSDRSVVFVVPGQLHANDVRTSFDLLDPALSGFGPAVYYDSNTPAGVPIDGAVDAVPSVPPVDWWQWDGAPGGLVMVTASDPGDGILTNYYEDDSSADPDDTGDGMRYADTGILISEPVNGDIGVAFISLTGVVVPPGHGNVGAMAAARVNSPLLSGTAAQAYPTPVERQLFLPILLHE